MVCFWNKDGARINISDEAFKDEEFLKRFRKIAQEWSYGPPEYTPEQKQAIERARQGWADAQRDFEKGVYNEPDPSLPLEYRDGYKLEYKVLRYNKERDSK